VLYVCDKVVIFWLKNTTGVLVILTHTIPYEVVLLKKKKEIFKPETATGRKRSTPLCYAKKSLFSGRNFQKNKSKR